MQNKPEYRMFGVAEFISEEEMGSHGYYFDSHETAIVYTYVSPIKSGEDDSKITKYIKTGLDTYQMIGSYLIKNIISIEEGRDKYPEIFI